MKTIKINCDVHTVMPVENMIPFQGDLKDLMEIDYQKLRKSIIKKGFIAPFFLWNNKEDGNWYLLDGHQRKRTLEKMQDEGFTLPEMPYVEVKAESYKVAKDIILSLSSAYGTMTPQGLYEFMSTADLDFNSLNQFRLPEINMDKFAEEFGDLPSPNEGDKKDSEKTGQHDLEEQYIVNVKCKDEPEMEQLFEELRERGFDVKLIT